MEFSSAFIHTTESFLSKLADVKLFFACIRLGALAKFFIIPYYESPSLFMIVYKEICIAHKSHKKLDYASRNQFEVKCNI